MLKKDKIPNQHFIRENGNKKTYKKIANKISDIRYRDILLENQLGDVKQKRGFKHYSYEKIIYDEANKHDNDDREFLILL